MTYPELLVRVSALRDLRRTQAERDAALAEKRAAFEQEHAVLIETAKLARDAVAAAETAIKAVAAERYAVTKDAKLCPGILVKEFDVLHYDADAALAWARETKMALDPERLNVKAFEKIAKAAPGIAGSYLVVEPRVQLASDLDAALFSASTPENVVAAGAE